MAEDRRTGPRATAPAENRPARSDPIGGWLEFIVALGPGYIGVPGSETASKLATEQAEHRDNIDPNPLSGGGPEGDCLALHPAETEPGPDQPLRVMDGQEDTRQLLIERDAARTVLAGAQQQARGLSAQLNHVRTIAAAKVREHPEGGSQSGGFREAPSSDGSKTEALRTWILPLGNKLAVQPSC
ncbi:hypothetical protein FN846DRAFT_903444 [Sphaerosporella brunnea]|uniref:Uncharacterized protein n=1 Tax=Sphaerosporella brunnea TaxID=1250544 RepID=A0A5J5F709_9PEZI|nr:hypothetical protein FN846DRAFT_903444 [Sphaerosporella brunnea]